MSKESLIIDNKQEIKQKLIERERNNKPEHCFCCIFLAHKDECERVRYFCPLSDVNIEIDKRADGCVLDA